MTGITISTSRQAPVFQEGAGAGYQEAFDQASRTLVVALVALPALAAAIATWAVSASLLHTVYAAGITIGVMSTVAFVFSTSMRRD
jgi:hypothetical protein